MNNMPQAILQSARLRLRPLTDDDFGNIHRMQSDPTIMRYIRAVSDEAAVRERMTLWRQYTELQPNYGVWVMEGLAEEGHPFIGYAVLRHVDYHPKGEIELGYTVDPAYEGHGFATETTKRLMAYAHEDLGHAHVVAFTDPNNLASNRVLEKCGFARDGLQPMYSGISQRWVFHWP